MKFKDYYQVLGLTRGAAPEEVKSAYRRMARKYHPDVSDEADAEERFKEVNEAYEVLKDPEKRTAYDQFGQHWKDGEQVRPPPHWSSGRRGDSPYGHSGGPAGFESAQFSSFFDMLFGEGARGAGPTTSDGRSQRAWSHSGAGDDVVVQVTLPLEDAYAGATRSLSLRVPEIDANGRVNYREKTLSARIPKGVREGQKIRLAGQGEPSLGDGTPGDLYLKVSFEPHPLFAVNGNDITVDLPVAPWEAALGRTVTVPTLGGRVDLRVPPQSQSGTRLRLKGRGLPAAKRGGKAGAAPGDQFVVLQIVNPKSDSDEARKLFEDMERELAFDPRESLWSTAVA